MKFSPIYWLLLAVLLRSLNQILMKETALILNDSFAVLFSTVLPVSIVIILMLRAFAWQKALENFPLSFAYPFSSLALLLLLLIGYMFYGEAISFIDLISMIFIMLGIFIMSNDSQAKVK